MLKAHKLRIYPTFKQRLELKHQFGCNRFVYNNFIGINQEHFDRGIKLSHFDMINLLVKMKKNPEFNFLNRAYSQSLQESLKNLCTAIKGLVKGTSCYPRRKNKYGQQSVAYPQGVKIKGKHIYFPKVGWVYFRDNRTIEGKIKTVTLKKNVADEYYASVLFENNKPLPTLKSKIKEHKILGIDLGITNFAITSNGDVYENPRYYVRNEPNLKRKQKKHSRTQKGSKRREKARIKVAKIHSKAKNRRNDFQQKLSSDMVNKYHAIVVEDLNVEGMVKNHKIAKHVYDAGWGEIRRMLEYKCKWNGKHFIKVDRFYPSSKTCNECRTINKDLSQGDREWQCSHCNTVHDRDFNAALNLQKMGIHRLKTEGYSVSARGGIVIPDPVHAGYRVGPVKREVTASVHH